MNRHLFTGVRPMLAVSANEAFDDEDFLFEPKWDGARMILHKQGERLEAYTRSGRRVTDNFPELKEAASAISAKEAVLDCEGICLNGGRAVFDDFAYRLRLRDSRRIAAAVRSHPASWIAFDVLGTTVEHLREHLIVRKDILRESILSSEKLAACAFVPGQGTALYAWTKAHRIEGIVAKRRGSVYRPGVVSEEWIKVKHPVEIDVMILGYRTAPVFALVIGLHFRTVRFKPVGLVETGIGEEQREAFLNIARGLLANKEGPTQWLRPELCCRIEYRDRSDWHELSGTTFLSFLPDKRADDCAWTY
ncbi:ATP-dependent DNA ligase [Paenibacillus xanthanilyticus]|uniref:DNA ligase n=1 Tax=Paenibacillus xanthanilyticus TaxID=1783531 RepID=A0ABV8JZ46_9BACL